jgi:hypothetical protein
VKERQLEAQQGQLERQPGRTMMESFEFVINQILNKVSLPPLKNNRVKKEPRELTLTHTGS